MSFDFAQAIRTRPGGNTRGELVAAYGDPLDGSRPDPRKRGWFIPSPQWEADNLVGISTADLPGFPPFGEQHVSKIKLHRAVAPIFRATWAELVRRGLHEQLRTYSGAFAPRHMGHDPKRAVSVHAYGAAIDFDAAWNGYGVPLERMQINREVVRCFEECGWHWGGRWTGAYADGMHFQWTDTLSGVEVPEWQDAMGKAPPAPRVEDIPALPLPPVDVSFPPASPVAPAPAPVRVMVHNGITDKWENLTGERFVIENADEVTVNASDPGTIWIRYLDRS